jgi:hypothetical protein
MTDDEPTEPNQADDQARPGQLDDAVRSSESSRGQRDLEGELSRLSRRVEKFEERTVDRAELTTELETYVDRRIRAGSVRGWGPYLVLLYGTVMTVAAFRYLSSAYAVAAMIIIWLSTVGLYTLMVVVSGASGVTKLPGWARERLRGLLD